MAEEILYGLSTNELKKEIEKCICEDQRALPQRSKIFAAVAKIQKFDVLPELVDVAELNSKVADGCIELNRGISSTKGVPAAIYAKDLVLGTMYPGTLSALGNGIYFAVPGSQIDPILPNFPKVSAIAMKYTKGENAGILVRAALKKNAKIADCDILKAGMREFKNRIKAAGITDIGTFAATLGYDAYYADGVYEDTDERIYTVLNRGALIVQCRAKLIGN